MSGSQLVEEILDRFGPNVVLEKARKNRVYLRVTPEALEDILKTLYSEKGGRLITISGMERRAGIELLYHVSFDDTGMVISLRAVLNGALAKMRSVAQFLSGAAWIEREIRDLLGLEFVGHPDPRPLLRSDGWEAGEFPLKKETDYDE